MHNIPKIYGVNLGNWLVLEKWMSPQMFSGTTADDEYHLARELSPEIYNERVRCHRAEYITEYDFEYLAKSGFNTVRIPIPFFIFGDRPPYRGCIEELDFAFDWAEKYGLKILIDLHTVPGSQNGFDNGGICGVCKWSGMPEEVEFVLKLLEKLSFRYGHRKGLWGIQPLNEPITDTLTGDIPWEETWIAKTYPAKATHLLQDSAPIKMSFLRQFYIDAYKCTMPNMANDKYFVIHDAFRTKTWTDFMQEDEFKNVILDTHFYLSNAEMGGIPKTPEGYIGALRGHFQGLMTEMQNYFPIICGEWCLDNSYIKDLPNGTEKDKVCQLLAKEQIDTWDYGSGFFYWNYKLHVTDEKIACWDLRKCILRGWMPTK